MRIFFQVLISLCLSCLVATATADPTYPSKPVRIIVPFAPGGGTDLVARTVAARLSERWKVPVVVDNKVGGNGIIGAEAAAKSPADGYTLFVVIDSILAMNQSLYSKLPYDPMKSFAPVTLATTQPMVLAVHPAMPIRSASELVAMARAQPGKLAYAHGAIPAQLAGELFKTATQTDLLAVPYKGSAPAMTDAAGGQVPLIFDALGPAMAFIKAGKVRALAVTSSSRSPGLPDVPTLAESGVPNVSLETWIGFVVPAGVEKAIVAKIHLELADIMQMPATRELVTSIGMSVVASTPEWFAQKIQDDAQKFSRVIKAAGIKLD